MSGRILGNEFWTPEFWTRILGSNFLILAFPSKVAPCKIHPREIHLPKFTFQNSTRKSGQKNHIAPLQGHLADKFPKVVRRGYKRSFEPRERKWACTGASSVCPVQTGFRMVQKTPGRLCSLGSKCLLHPLLTTFGTLPCSLSGPISRDTAILSLRYPISRDTF